MNVNFELYRIFYTVVQHGNITKAALELYISQPAVSKAIKKLEDELGGNIFKRTKKGVVLTEEGKELYNYVAKAIDYLNCAENKFKDLMRLETGNLRIGTSATITRHFLMPYLEAFHTKYPNINIEIKTGLNRDLVKRLKNGLLDMVILNLPYEDNDLEIKKLKSVQDCFAVGKKYKYLKDKIISFNEIAKYPLILQSKGSSTRSFLDNICVENKIIFKPQMSPASYSLVEDFTKTGFGIGYLTLDFIDKDLINKELFILNTKEEIPKRNLGVATYKVTSFSANEMINLITKKE